MPKVPNYDNVKIRPVPKVAYRRQRKPKGKVKQVEYGRAIAHLASIAKEQW